MRSGERDYDRCSEGFQQYPDAGRAGFRLPQRLNKLLNGSKTGERCKGVLPLLLPQLYSMG